MTWLYIPSNSAPASACSEKAPAPHSSFLDTSTAPFATWSGKPLQPRNLSALWKRERLIRRLSGLTCSPSTAQLGADAWISSLRASRAKTSQSPAAVPGLTVRGLAFSSACSTSPTIAVRGSLFWRTSQESLLPPPPLWTKPKARLKSAPPPASWENWPTEGGTRNGSLFPRPMWAQAMDARGGSALPGGGMWTTPDVCSGSRDMSKIDPQAQRCAATKRTTGLPTEAAYWAAPMWMTPTTQSAKGVDYQRVNGKNVLILDGQAKALMEQWPTPRATDGTKGGPNQAGSKGDLMLPSAAAQWPTPASRDYRTPNSKSLADRGQGTKGEQLPNFVQHHFSPQGHPTLSGATSSVPVVSVHGSELSPTTRPERVLGRLRLNPAFACWLMGWPIWWTNPALTSCARAEMASYRRRLGAHLSYCLGGLGYGRANEN